jgi:Flp pilus assembly protein CpaB
MIDRRTRIRNLAVAGGLAVAAAILTMLYVARSDGKAAAPAVALRPVLVATRDLQIGTSFSSAFENGAIALRRLPSDAVAPDGVASPRLLQGDVVVQPVFRGEQITARRFGPSGLQGYRGALRGSLRAITIPGDAQQLLLGTLKQGDHVDVVVNDRVDQQHPKTRVALRNLIVLEAPSDDAEAQTGGTATYQTTVQLTDQQVQVLWWAVKNGDWSFVLRPSSGASVSADAATTEQQVLVAR